MARPDLKVRADALRAEAAVARRQLDETYESSRAELRRQTLQSTRDAETASYGAERAAQHANASRSEAMDLWRIVDSTEQQAAKHVRDGNLGEAEESREVAAMRRREADATSEEARQLDIEAAKLREDEAGHRRRMAELHDEDQDLHGRYDRADTNLDNLENQTRLYDEAWRKFAAAEATENIPERAQFELEAEKALRGADAIEVDRAAIRVFVPDLPDVTPGLPSAPTATPATELGDDSTAEAIAASDDLDLGLVLDAQAEDDADAANVGVGVGVGEVAVGAGAAADESFPVEAAGADDVASFAAPEVAIETFAPSADDAAFAMADSFGFDAPADAASGAFESTGDTFDA
jgi:hypothetical protein